MKTIILIEKGKNQLVLQSENGHDKSVLNILETLPNSYKAEFKRDSDGFSYYGIGQFDNKDLIIVFDTDKVTYAVEYVANLESQMNSLKKTNEKLEKRLNKVTKKEKK